MNTSKIFFIILISIFLISVASAASVSYGEWQDGSNSISINNGTSAGFNFYFDSTSSSTHASIKMYDSSGNLIYTFLDQNIPTYYYNSDPIMVTPQIYQNPGTYTITFYSDDSSNSPSAMTIYLTVNPTIPSTNISLILNLPYYQTVNANSFYSYQVNATDSNGNNLTYSLDNNPPWLSINSATGLITGLVPNVTTNTSYIIDVTVSDQFGNYVVSSYDLTITPVTPTPPTFPLQIQFVYPTPANNAELQQTYIPVQIYASSDLGISSINANLYNSAYSLVNTASSIFSSGQLFNFTGLSPGTYYVNAIAFDNAGNSNSTELTITLLAVNNNQINGNIINTGYQYSDIYTNQYLQQISKINSGINLNEPAAQSPSPSSNNAWIFLLLIVSTFILIIAVILIFLIRKLREN